MTEEGDHSQSTEETLNIQEQANRLYRGNLLAPMVRASTTPLRTLALEYGADAVYSEELVDRSISHTIRQINETLGTIDYVKDASQLSKKAQKKLLKENRPCLILRLDPKREQGKIICQLGSGEPELALTAAQHVYQDFAAIDINMGCPKKFSVSGGMGSALLSDPERAAKLISTLRASIPRPISCKIRLLQTVEATVAFVQKMIEAGANAVAIHARRVGHDATAAADWKSLKEVLATLRDQHPKFPFLVNGDFYDRAECQELLKETGASGVLLGRPALYNTSIFRPLSQALEDKTVVIQNYLRNSARYDIHFKNPKYVVCEMMNNRRAPSQRVPDLPQDFPGGQTIAKTCNCTSLKLMFGVWNVPWKGIGIISTDITSLAPTDSTTALAPGEHRYEDSYFLKKRSNGDSAPTSLEGETASKRAKSEENIDGDATEEKKLEDASIAIQ